MNWIEKMNKFGHEKTPFLFLIDFLGQNGIVCPLDKAEDEVFFFQINESNNSSKNISNQNFYNRNFNDYSENYLKNLSQKYNLKTLTQKAQNYTWKTQKPDFQAYSNAFNLVQTHLQRGDSYLLNLSAPTLIETDLYFEEIFLLANAKYKILYQDQFMCFSPESFIKINQKNEICTFPMKGTINAQIPNAQQIILDDQKELAEHYTIVDLMRNDLSQIAKKVRVKDFRYIDKIITQHKNLLQVSSHIEGILPKNYRKNLGDMFHKLLPAGSISGAPKPKTLDIIQEAEDFFYLENGKKYQRNFYTGIGGMYDGQCLESCVLIRFLEKEKIDFYTQNIYFKSGGGITSQSDLLAEYQELCDKVYLPF